MPVIELKTISIASPEALAESKVICNASTPFVADTSPLPIWTKSVVGDPSPSMFTVLPSIRPTVKSVLATIAPEVLIWNWAEEPTLKSDVAVVEPIVTRPSVFADGFFYFSN